MRNREKETERIVNLVVVPLEVPQITYKNGKLHTHTYSLSLFFSFPLSSPLSLMFSLSIKSDTR